MQNPLVSIVIPCYNHQDYVQECLKSIIVQSYLNIEVIIINDGSTDNSALRIMEIQDLCRERFNRFEFRSRMNKGLCTTLNEGFAWCQGKYVCILASDDTYLPNKIQVQVDYLEKSDDEVKGVFGSINFVDEKGHIIRTELLPTKKYNFKEIFLHKHNLPATTNMLKMKYIREMNFLPENLIIDDWFMWLKLTEKGGFLIRLNYLFTNYRRHSSNMSGVDKQSIIKMNIGRRQVIDLFKDNPMYPESDIRIMWVKFTEYISYKVNKKEAFLCFRYIARKDIKKLLSLSAIKFYIKTLLRYLKVNI